MTRSSAKTVTVTGALLGITVLVKDAVKRKPLMDARVVIDEVEFFTDEAGMAKYEPLPPGSYKVSISKKDYKSTSRTVEIVEVGVVLTVGLWPLWAIGLGVVGGAAVTTVVVVKAVEKKGR